MDTKFIKWVVNKKIISNGELKNVFGLLILIGIALGVLICACLVFGSVCDDLSEMGNQDNVYIGESQNVLEVAGTPDILLPTFIYMVSFVMLILLIRIFGSDNW